MGGAGSCGGKTFWFKPGVYYFDFHNSEMPTSGSPVIPNGPDVWTFNDTSGVLVAGTKQGWTTSTSNANMPGSCVSPLTSMTQLRCPVRVRRRQPAQHQQGQHGDLRHLVRGQAVTRALRREDRRPVPPSRARLALAEHGDQHHAAPRSASLAAGPLAQQHGRERRARRSPGWPRTRPPPCR